MSKFPTNLAIIGTGRVAEAFVSYFSKFNTLKVVVIGRNRERLDYINRKYSVDVSVEFEKSFVDWAIVAVADAALVEIVPKIKAEMVSITAGTVDWSIFGAHCSILYPLQTFAYNTEIDLAKVPFILDGDAPTLNTLKLWAERLSISTQCLSKQEREKIHVVAVFLNNFVHHVMAKGIVLAKQFDLDSNLFVALIDQTYRQFDIQNPHLQQTGPAVRDDEITIEKHRKYLTEENLLLYDMLTKSIKSAKYGEL